MTRSFSSASIFVEEARSSFPRVGQRELWLAVKENNAVILFQLLDVLAQILLGYVELLRRVGEMKLFRQLHEIIQTE